MNHNNGNDKVLSATIMASSHKMVNRLKDIVSNFPDHKIYVMLKDYNMDPEDGLGLEGDCL